MTAGRARAAPTILKRLQPWLAVAALCLAIFLVYRALRQFSADEIVESLRAISTRHVALGLAFTFGSFLCLSASDAIAVRYTGRSLPYRKIALASFTSLSIGHTLGFAALSSGALRYRFYTRWGLSRGDVGRIILCCGVTVAVGALTVGGFASVVRPAVLAELFMIPAPAIVGVGVLLLLIVAIYLALAAFVHRSIHIRRFELPVPTLPLALGQVAVGTTDFLLVAAVLHQMLLASTEIEYLAVAAAYMTANVAGVVTHVPGGIGVIEAIVVLLVPGAHVAGALIAFRVMYYLVPFGVGCLALAAAEVSRVKERL